jgi:hypothetical protein
VEARNLRNETFHRFWSSGPLSWQQEHQGGGKKLNWTPLEHGHYQPSTPELDETHVTSEETSVDWEHTCGRAVKRKQGSENKQEQKQTIAAGALTVIPSFLLKVLARAA